MAVNAKELAIESPCPVDLDRALSDGRTRAWDCGHCSKTVHVLSSMTERDARRFLRKHEGQTLCITYLEGDDGAIRFQPDPPVVPLAALTRRRVAAAAAGFAAALAACTPSEGAPQPAVPIPTVSAAAQTEVEPKAATSIAKLVDKARVDAQQHAAQAKTGEVDVGKVEKVEKVEHHPHPIVDPSAVPRPGGLMIPRLPSTPSGEGTVAAIEDEPCDPEVAKVVTRPPRVRGGRLITPIR